MSVFYFYKKKKFIFINEQMSLPKSATAPCLWRYPTTPSQTNSPRRRHSSSGSQGARSIPLELGCLSPHTVNVSHPTVNAFNAQNAVFHWSLTHLELGLLKLDQRLFYYKEITICTFGCYSIRWSFHVVSIEILLYKYIIVYSTLCGVVCQWSNKIVGKKK